MSLEDVLRNGDASGVSIIFKQQVSSPYKSLQRFSQAFLAYPALTVFLQMDLNVISWTLLRDFKVVIKHQHYPALMEVLSCLMYSSAPF